MKKYRIYVGSIQQETNSLSPVSAGLDDFERLAGDCAVSKLSIAPLQRDDVELIKGTYAHAVPSGMLGRDVFDVLLGDLLSLLPADADGAFLYLHGALDVEGIGSGDARIVRAVREKLGPRARIAVAVDFHANVSPELVENADVICAYRTAPHTDMEETQERACALLMDLLTRGCVPKACLVHIPMLFTGDCVITDNEPARSLMSAIEIVKAEENAFAIAFCFGQPWVDTRWVGPSVTAYADDVVTACRAAQRVAHAWWEARASFGFLTETCMPEDAMMLARTSETKPVFLSDSGDNITAGAAGDRAGMLNRALCDGGSLRTLIAGLTDAGACGRAHRLGTGSQAEFCIGGTLDRRHADICRASFEVVGLGNMLGWYGEDAGPCALLRHGRVDVIITERRCAVISPEIILSGGADLRDYDAVVVKLGYLYPALAAVAPRAVFVLTQGVSTARIDTIRYTQVPHANYPADQHVRFDACPAYIKEESPCLSPILNETH